MAIFKVITAPDGTAIGHATPQKLEDYLRYELDEDGNIKLDFKGEPITRSNFISAINADDEDFTYSCRLTSARFNTNNDYADLKYKHYVQGFPPEDNELMTKDKCHALGVELAQTLWGDFPVLVVSHFEQEIEGTDQYHWHNHFIVYNCAVTDGHKLDTSRAELRAQKRYVIAQADGNGLTKKGLVLDENGEIRKSTMPDRIDRAERYIEKHGQAVLNRTNSLLPNERIKQRTFMTQKAELRLAVQTARGKALNYEDFKQYLFKTYGVEVKESRGHISYRHPEREGYPGEWIRGETLGAEYTKESIINAITEQRNRSTDIGRKTAAEQSSIARSAGSQDVNEAAERHKRIERTLELYRSIFAENRNASDREIREPVKARKRPAEDRTELDNVKRNASDNDKYSSREDQQADGRKHGSKL